MLKSMKYGSTVLAAALLALAGASNLAEADAPAKGTIIGTVVGVDGKPAAGVTVRLFAPPAKRDKESAGDARPDKPEKSDAKLEADPRKPGKRPKPAPVAEAKTDSTGAFKLEGIEPGNYMVGAGERGMGRGKARVTVAAGQTASVEIKLEKRGGPEEGKGNNKDGPKAKKNRPDGERPGGPPPQDRPPQDRPQQDRPPQDRPQ